SWTYIGCATPLPPPSRQASRLGKEDVVDEAGRADKSGHGHRHLAVNIAYRLEIDGVNHFDVLLPDEGLLGPHFPDPDPHLFGIALPFFHYLAGCHKAPVQ